MIEIWLIGALKPLEIEGDLREGSATLKKISATFSGSSGQLIISKTIDGDIILIPTKNIAYLKSIKEA